jgi:hypothetical protein
MPGTGLLDALAEATALQCNDDEDLASIVKGVVQEIRDSPVS